MSDAWHSKILLSLCVAGSLFCAACDSGSGLETGDLIGSYTFTTLTFDPVAAAVPPINVLDTLVLDETELRLVEDGQFLLLYRFVDGSADFATGGYRIDDGKVRLEVREADRESFRKLLLEPSFRLNVFEGGVRLEGRIERQDVDLGDFSERYRGTSADGTLTILLNRR